MTTVNIGNGRTLESAINSLKNEWMFGAIDEELNNIDVALESAYGRYIDIEEDTILDELDILNITY